jgi:Domain of unknown function (DUF4326)
MTRIVSIHRDAWEVYVGRAGKGQAGTFGNPFHLAGSRALTLERYRDYLLGRLASDPEFRAQVEGLRGKVLGCFCAPKGGLLPEADPAKALCHGQILAAAAEGHL